MKKSNRGILINEALLALPEIKRMIKAEGPDGLGKFIFTLFYLKNCYHSIGRMDDTSLGLIAKYARKHKATIKKFIMKWGIFTICGDGEFFVYPHYRKNFGFDVMPSEKEYEVIAAYGNFIKYEPKEITSNTPEKEPTNCKVFDCPNKTFSKTFQRPMKSFSTISKKRNSQSTDSETVASPLYNINSTTMSKGIGIIRKGNNITIPTTTVSVVDSSAGGAEEKVFFNFLEKKLISCINWKNYFLHSLGITSDGKNDIMHIFREMMRRHCILKKEMPLGKNVFSASSANLPEKDLHTPKCCDGTSHCVVPPEVPGSSVPVDEDAVSGPPNDNHVPPAQDGNDDSAGVNGDGVTESIHKDYTATPAHVNAGDMAAGNPEEQSHGTSGRLDDRRFMQKNVPK